MYMKIGKNLQETFANFHVHLSENQNLAKFTVDTVMYMKIGKYPQYSVITELLLHTIVMYMKIGKISPYTNLL